MSLINLLHECISRGLTQAIAIAQVMIAPRLAEIITEVADLIGKYKNQLGMLKKWATTTT